MPHHDVFVAYSAKDRERIRPYVEQFRRARLSVWWDQRIEEGQWSDEIETELATARRIVAFLTPSSVESGAVLVEIRRAKERSCLIPVWIERCQLKYALDIQIVLIQQYDFHGLSADQQHERLQQLLGVLCRAAYADLPCQDLGQQEPDAESRVRDWFAPGRSIQEVAFASALALLRDAPIHTVDFLAEAIDTRLCAARPAAAASGVLSGPEAAAAPSQRLFDSTPREQRLRAVEAEIFTQTNPRYGLPYECCRFRDVERAGAFLRYVFREHRVMHDLLMGLIFDLATGTSQDLRLRLGIAAGALARQDFGAVLHRLIQPLALDDDFSRREVASFILAVAATDAATKGAVKTVLTDWVNAARSPARVRAAAEFAAGYVGGIIPEIVIPTLKTAAKSKDIEVLDALSGALNELVCHANAGDDTSLLNIDNLIEALGDWAIHPDPTDHPIIPMHLFMKAVGALPVSVSGWRDAVSLQTLAFPENDGTSGAKDRKALKAIAKVFEQALRNRVLRNEASDIIKSMAEQRSDANTSPDPLLELARLLLRECTTDRDRSRIAFLLRKYYDRDDLNYLTLVA